MPTNGWSNCQKWKHIVDTFKTLYMVVVDVVYKPNYFFSLKAG